MSAIFSVQNLQTFLRRKNLRPPSRGGPPGPERPPPPPPPYRGRSPPGRGPSERGLSLGADCSGAFVSSAIILLHLSAGISSGWRGHGTRPESLYRDSPRYVAAGASTGAAGAGAAASSTGAAAAGCA